MCYVNKMTNTKEVVDIFLNSKITNISDPENYSISELGGITNNSFKVGVDDKFFVLRLPGKNPDLINRKAEKNIEQIRRKVLRNSRLPFEFFRLMKQSQSSSQAFLTFRVLKSGLDFAYGVKST